MFKKSKSSVDQDLFKSVAQQVGGRKYEDLVNKNAWHNVFYTEITSKIDEEIFSPLFSSKMGRPNTSIRILVGMIVLKEAQGWTDNQLYDNCRFNLSIMRALGLTNIDDEVPVPSTYYDFKSKLDEYYSESGVNLFSELFSQITTAQIEKHQLSGSRIRMDSKLIQSNIGTWSRLQKIIQGLQVFCRELSEKQRGKVRKKADREFISKIMSKTPGNHLYGMNKDEKLSWTRRLGFLIRKILNLYSAEPNKYYENLARIYADHYKEDKEKGEGGDQTTTTPRNSKEMKADSIQSIHDGDAAYRIKGHGESRQSVSGYSSNITEALDPKVNLITDVQVEKATYSDDQYLLRAIENTEKVTGQQVIDIHTDGGYDSISNRESFGEKMKDKRWHLSKIKGGARFRFRKAKNGEIEVYDKKADYWTKATKCKSGKYKIRLSVENVDRYFPEQRIESSLILEKIRPNEIDTGIRANVEATINQVFHTLNGKKSKYRGLMRHRIFTTSRCLWVNCKRIKDYWDKQMNFTIQMTCQPIGVAFNLNGTKNNLTQLYAA